MRRGKAKAIGRRRGDPRRLAIIGFRSDETDDLVALRREVVEMAGMNEDAAGREEIDSEIFLGERGGDAKDGGTVEMPFPADPPERLG